MSAEKKKQTKGRGKRHKKFVINMKEICKNQVSPSSKFGLVPIRHAVLRDRHQKAITYFMQ